MKTKRIEIRLSVQDHSRIKLLAKLYAGGDVTAWITHGALNAPRQKVKKKPARVLPRTDPGEPSAS